MLYQYTALNNNKKIKAEMEAGSEKEITEYLKTNGLFPIEIKIKNKNPFSQFSRFFERVGFKDISFLTRQLSIMLNAGLTLIDSINIIKKQIKKSSLSALLEDIDLQLRDGKTFSDALSLYPNNFSYFYIALIKSGEATGKLDDILGKLAEHMEKQAEFNQKIKNAMIYPVVIICAMIGMIFVMFTFVMPKLLELYDNFKIELPQSTKIVMAISRFMEANWGWVLLGMVGVFIGLSRLLKTTKGKEFMGRYSIKLPIFGNIIKISGLVDATRTLAILISSGVPILDGLAIVTDLNPNIIFRQAFGRITQKVEKGLSMGSAMSNEPIFPESLIQMTIVGEQTGHLDETLMKTAEYYQIESENAVKGMLTMLEPTIIIVLGVTVGFLVMTIITPIFSLTNSLSN